MTLFLIVLQLSHFDSIFVKVNSYSYSFSNFEKELITDIISLYKSKSKKDLTLVFNNEQDFEKFFHFPKKGKAISINAITITEERKRYYSFSLPYFPVKQAVLSIKNKRNIDWKGKSVKICLEKKSLHYNTAKTLAKKYNWKIYHTNAAVEYTKDIADGRYDIFVSDIITSWSDRDTFIVLDAKDEVLDQSNYAMLFRKNDPLQMEIDKILKYYLKTPRYFNLIKKYFGDRAVEYIRSFK